MIESMRLAVMFEPTIILTDSEKCRLTFLAGNIILPVV